MRLGLVLGFLCGVVIVLFLSSIVKEMLALAHKLFVIIIILLMEVLILLIMSTAKNAILEALVGNISYMIQSFGKRLC